ncbi:MAG TPA: type II toxin-antitoxin system Phd/YefM family antitoxin [Longimicrobium sp.]
MVELSSHKKLLASEARAKFSSLLEEVSVHPGRAIYIARRDHKDAAVLVDAAHYEVLMRKAELVDHPPGEPFRLAGSMRLLVSPDELEAGIAAERRRQAELAAAKFNNL